MIPTVIVHDLEEHDTADLPEWAVEALEHFLSGEGGNTDTRPVGTGLDDVSSGH